MVKKTDNCKFRVTYLDVTTSRRVSFATSVGIRDEPFGIAFLAFILSHASASYGLSMSYGSCHY